MVGETPRLADRIRPAQPTGRVLVAEDNPTNQVVVTSILEMFGLASQVVADGASAIEAWARGGVDLILLDDRMPGMDGVSALRAIRAVETGQGLTRTPIIVLSANAMPGQVADYLAAGADGYVSKPIELKSLRATMAQVMRSGRDAEAAA